VLDRHLTIGTRGTLAIVMVGWMLGGSAARSEAPAAEPSGNSAGGTPSGEQARKAEILASEPWRRAMFEFNAWLDVQPVYTSEQVRRIRRELADRVAGMSSFELEYLLETMDAKLQVLDSPAARDARGWLGRYLAVMSDAKRTAVLKDVPDILEMTAAELEAAVKQVEAKRTDVERQRAKAIATRAEFGLFQQAAGEAAAADRARMAAVRGGAPSFSPYRGPAVESPPFANAYDSPTVVGVGPWGVSFGIPTGAF
jgi:hypothetical protein